MAPVLFYVAVLIAILVLTSIVGLGVLVMGLTAIEPQTIGVYLVACMLVTCILLGGFVLITFGWERSVRPAEASIDGIDPDIDLDDAKVKPVFARYQPKPFVYRIHLVKKDEFDLGRSQEWMAGEECFLKLGFQEVGKFEIAEMPGTYHTAFGHVEHQLWGVVGVSSSYGQYLEVWGEFESGGSWCANNVAKLALINLDPLPGRLRVHVPGADATELLDRWLRVKESFAVKPLVFSEYQSASETEFRESLEARLVVGYSPDEVGRIMKANGRSLDWKQLDVQTRALRFTNMQRLDVALRERFREASGLSESALKQIANRLVIVHEKLTTFEAIAKLGGRKAVSGVTPDHPIEAFEVANNALDPEIRFLKLADLSKPLRAVVYVLPDLKSNHDADV